MSYGDDIISDGDGTAPVASSTPNLGTICVGQATQDDLLIGIKRAWPTTPTPNPP